MVTKTYRTRKKCIYYGEFYESIGATISINCENNKVKQWFCFGVSCGQYTEKKK